MLGRPSRILEDHDFDKFAKDFFKKYSDHNKHHKHVNRMALPGDAFVALVTAFYVYDLEVPQSRRGQILNQIRSNKFLEQYVNHRGWFQQLPHGKIRADYMEALCFYIQEATDDLWSPLPLLADYIQWSESRYTSHPEEDDEDEE